MPMFVKLSPIAALSVACLAAPLAAQAPSTPTPPPAPPAPPRPACTAPEFRQFDFWVGRWDVYPTGTQQLVAHSLIENLYAGCAIRENWMPLPGGQDGDGGSLNVYRPAEHRWRQTWTDSGNSLVDFYGGIEDGKMVLTGTRPGVNGAEFLVRIEYSRNPDGSVRQVGTRSADHGQTWQPRYDFTYRQAR
jgi:hypothetical protein